MIRFKAIEEDFSQEFHRKADVNGPDMTRNQGSMLLDTSSDRQARAGMVDCGHTLNLGGLFSSETVARIRLEDNQSTQTCQNWVGRQNRIETRAMIRVRQY